MNDAILINRFMLITSKILRVEPTRDSQEWCVAGDVSRGHPLENWGCAATVYPVPGSFALWELLEELAFSALLHGYTP